MKKLLVVLLSLGLLVAFSMTASAADVKFSGQYYVSGVYENNRSFKDTDATNSRAFIWNRARVQTVFQVAEGLSFTTRFDAFEKQWGAVNRSANSSEDKSNSGKVNSIGTTLQENIEMEHAYVTFKTMVGQFQIGYQAADEWGTGFADTPGSRPRAIFSTAFGPMTVMAVYEKQFEADTNRLRDTVTVGAAGVTNVTAGTGTAAPNTGNQPSTKVDADTDVYRLAGIYNFKGGNAGLLYSYTSIAANRSTLNSRTKIHSFTPYMKATFGPVYVEAEFVYITGKNAEFETPSTTPDVSREGMGAYILAKMNLGPAYVGVNFGYSSGDDGSDATKNKTGPSSTTSWTPALILGNANLKSWVYGSDVGGANGVSYTAGDKANFVVYNAFAGFNPTPKINVEAAISFMSVDKKPFLTATTSHVSKTLGTEFDVKASYKIYDNLTYMVGAGYLVTGDFYKGASDTNKVGNDYILLNQLTINF